jgi:hypothetical protein
MNGVSEESRAFQGPLAIDGPARFRSIAGIGPVYEIVSVGQTTVQIRFVDEDETHEYPLADAECDPIA